MDDPIKEGEIQDIISSLKNNKSPGPDGFANEFYKTFKDVISPLLLEAYHYALKFERGPAHTNNHSGKMSEQN